MPDNPNGKLFIFDLGNVSFHIDFNKTFAYWAQEFDPIYDGLDVALLRSKFQFDDTHKLYEKGRITRAAYAKHVGMLLGVDMSERTFLSGWNQIYGAPLNGIFSILRMIRTKGHKSVALSNTNDGHQQIFPSMYSSLLEYFDEVFLSHAIGMIKPDSQCYESVLKMMNCTPINAYFFDDKIENVKAAKELGIYSLVITKEQGLAEVQQLVNDLLLCN